MVVVKLVALFSFTGLLKAIDPWLMTRPTGGQLPNPVGPVGTNGGPGHTSLAAANGNDQRTPAVIVTRTLYSFGFGCVRSFSQEIVP